MSDITKFTITKHASERLYERCHEFAKVIDSIEAPALRIKAAYDFVRNATEEKRFINNSIFMIKLNEKYGYENSYTFFVRENNVLVGVINENGRFIVTVLDRMSHVIPHIKYKTTKFNKSKKANKTC